MVTHESAFFGRQAGQPREQAGLPHVLFRIVPGGIEGMDFVVWLIDDPSQQTSRGRVGDADVNFLPAAVEGAEAGANQSRRRGGTFDLKVPIPWSDLTASYAHTTSRSQVSTIGGARPTRRARPHPAGGGPAAPPGPVPARAAPTRPRRAAPGRP